MSVSANLNLLAYLLTILQAFTTTEHMEEDILSDVVPSNIVSRQASPKEIKLIRLHLIKLSA